ncbi:hypothetical protein VTP01DRAFT_5675 [Rhizomucor pusillus]|uniref:uncharacterized protein n=1 Tax=Rhizomucor pusillus TaxID=4840 RepID=UPI003741F50A
MANALSCAMYYLALNLIRDIQQKAQEEALSVLGDGSDDILPIVEQSKNLTYINRVILEGTLISIEDHEVFNPGCNGARKCIGMNFSLAESRVPLTLLLRRYEWPLPEDCIHKHGIVTTGVGIIHSRNLKIVLKNDSNGEPKTTRITTEIVKK